MKLFLLISVSLLSARAFSAVTTLEFNLTGDVYRGSSSVALDVKSLNRELGKKKLAPLPEKLVWSKYSNRQWSRLISQIRRARKALRKDIDITPDRGYLYEFPTICYRGNAAEVPEIVESLMGTVLHSDQEIQAYKLGATKVIHIGNGFFENNKERHRLMRENNPEQVKLWINYKKSSDTVLVLSDYGPQGDGTELTATEIKKCQ